MSEYIAITTALLFLFAYTVLSSIEFGASIFQMWPVFFRGGRGALRIYLNPVWEVTTVFLVTFIVAMFTLFPGATLVLGTALLVNLFVALVIFSIRILCMLVIYYGGIEDSKLVNSVFLASSLAAPVALSTPLAFMLASGSPELSTVYWTLGALVVAGTVLVSTTFFRWFTTRNSERTSSVEAGAEPVAMSVDPAVISSLVFRAYVFWLVAITLFTSAVSAAAPHVHFASLAGALGLAGTALGTGLFAYAEQRARAWVSFVASCTLLASVFFALAYAHLPYILYPKLTIYNSFTGEATFKIFMVVLGLGLAVTVPSLIWMYRLFTFRRD